MYAQTAAFLHDNSLLEATHWSEEHGAFLDWGLHTERVRLERPRPQKPGQPPPQDKVRVTVEEPSKRFVNQLGYVSKCFAVYHSTVDSRLTVFSYIKIRKIMYKIQTELKLGRHG